MTTPILFLVKAAMRGDSHTADLFDSVVHVRPTIRADGAIIPGHTRVQKVKRKAASGPSDATKQKIAELTRLKVEAYRAKGDPNPEAAGHYAVEDILNMYKEQPAHIDQLLDEEIEDAKKAAATVKESLQVADARTESRTPQASEPEPAQAQTVGGGHAEKEYPVGDKMMTAAQMADVASRYGHDYDKALSRIRTKPSAWIAAVGEWLDAEDQQRKQDRKESADAAWAPNEKQQKVIDLIRQSGRFSQENDAPMFSHNIRSTRTLIRRGVISRVAFDDGTVEYRINGDTAKDDAPKEGDTKSEGGVTYVLRDGRWHRAEPDAPATEFRATHELSDGTPVVAHPDDTGVWIDEHGDEYESDDDEVSPIAGGRGNSPLRADDGPSPAAQPNPTPTAREDVLNDRAVPAAESTIQDSAGDEEALAPAETQDVNVETFPGVAEEGTNQGIVRKLARARAEKLRGVANKLLDDASEAQGRDRLANTSRRASMAAHAIDRALADESLARTMLRIADAIESGEAKHLESVSTKAGVETLRTILRNAMTDRDLADTGGSYLEEQRRKGRPADAADLNYVKWPRAQINDNDRLHLIEGLKGKRGGKNVADSIRYGDLTPESWSDIKRLLGEKEANFRVGWYPIEMIARQQRLARMGINGPDDLHNAIGEYIRLSVGKKAEDPVAVAERALVGQNVGVEYFPTPKPVASRMAELAGIRPGMRVLEPSAGNGNLADAARDAGADVDTIEISHALRAVLEAKKYPIVAHDFDSHKAPGAYDAVIMNPPFSRDAEHIQRAYDMLKPGGTLVSIAGEGVFFRSDKRATGFRSWLEDVGADVEQLPANTFMDRTLQNTTGANARLVVIHKPQGEMAQPVSDGPREGDTKTEDGIEYVLQSGRWHRVTPDAEPQADEPAHDPVEHAENKADLAEELIRNPASDKAAELAVKVADGVKAERIQMVRDKVEEMGGKEIVARTMRLAQKDAMRSKQAEKVITDLMAATGLSRDDVLAEFGLAERAKPVRKQSERKPLAPEGGTEFSDDDPRSPNYRYRDTGYIAGSRKEKAAEMIRAAGRNGQQLRATDIDWVEIEANPRLAKELITKSNLFGKVDWAALQEGGMEPGAGFLVDRVYASIAQEPSADDPNARKNYAIGLESIRDRLERCKTAGDVTNALSDIRDEFEGVSLNADETAAYNAVQKVISGLAEHYRKLRIEHDQLANVEISLRHEASGLHWQQKKRTDRGWKPDPIIASKIEALQPQIQEATRKREEWDASNPEYHSESVTEQVDGWTKFRKVGGIEGKMDEAYAVRRAIVDRAKARNKAENPLHQAWQLMGARFQGTINYSRYKGSDTFAKHVTAAKTGKIKDWSWAEKEPSVAPKVREQAVRFQLQVADGHERIGGRPVMVDSTAALKSMFNLRDVQSGNWVLNDPESAAFHTQRCAEAFADLADLVGVPGDVVAMNGRLAMAFGARGSGSKGWKEGAHRAHYEPVERVINLTKMGGGGSLGHEWFHAFDNMVAEIEGGKGTTTGTFASKNPDVLPPGDLRDAFHALRSALTTGTRRLYKRVGYDAKHYRLAKHNLDRPATSLSRMGAKIVGAGDLGAAVDSVRSAYGTVVSNREKKQRDEWIRIAAAWYDGKEGGGEAMIPHGEPVSNLMAEAVRLDHGEHGKYWSQIEELAARSAQAWMEDRLAGNGQRNDYLSAKADNKYYYDPINGQLRPYPEGEERERLNAAFDRLFEAARKAGTLHKAFAQFAA